MTGNLVVLSASGLGRAPRGWRVKVTLSLDRSGLDIVDFCNEEDMKDMKDKGKRSHFSHLFNKFRFAKKTA